MEARLTDGELIAAVRLGNAEAWRELYTRWMPWVWRYAYTLVQDTHVAEDVTSETMAAWVKNLDRIGSDAPQVAAWLRSVVRHKAADHHRSSARFRKATEGVAAVAEVTARDDSPSQPLETAEAREQVVLALGRLKETHRVVLEWKYADGMSVRQVAERLGMTEKAIEANLYRARREFRRQFEAIQNAAPSAPPQSEPTAPIVALRLRTTP